MKNELILPVPNRKEKHFSFGPKTANFLKLESVD